MFLFPAMREHVWSKRTTPLILFAFTIPFRPSFLTLSMNTLALSLLSAATSALALSVPSHHGVDHQVKPRASCENTATSRSCWGDYSVDTDYDTITPDTGVTKEYWLNVEEGPCSPDGIEVSTCITFNGTIPGPAIIVSQPKCLHETSKTLLIY